MVTFNLLFNVNKTPEDLVYYEYTILKSPNSKHLGVIHYKLS